MAKRAKKQEGYVNPIVKGPDAARAIDLIVNEDDDTESELQEKVRALIQEARDHYEEELEPDQVSATEYFKGEPFGDEREGRSKVVNTVVRDAVLAAIPSLMRIVYEADNVAEYRPRQPEDEPGAKQATDYVRYVITEDNEGFAIFWAWIMDALVRRIGTVKWWWDPTITKTKTEYTGLTEQEFMVLASDPEVEIAKGSTRTEGEGEGATTLFDCTVFHVERDGMACVACVPNEEFVFTPNARSLKDARIVAHVREMPTDELIALLVADGMDEAEATEVVEENKGKRRHRQSDDLEAARQFDGLNRRELGGEGREKEDFCLYTEAYGRIKVEDDPDGYDEPGMMPELRLFKCVGPKYVIVNGDGLGECTDELPFATWTPIPEPHTVVGQSFWDLLKDIQRIISQIERGTLDSLAQTLNPVTEVVQGMVNMQDFISGEVSGIRRVRAIGQTQTIVHHFVGGDALPVLGYYNEVVEQRTGKNKGAMGLDADALQSTTKVAAAAILSASQQRIEIIARVFAETAMKPLFKGLLKLITKHQQPGRIVRLRNEYVEVDPRTWDSGMDVTVNVALGAGTPTDRIEVLAGIATKQQELMSTGSPLVSNIELRRTLARIAELGGEKHSQLYFKPWGEQEEMAMQQQMQQQQPPPDPNMALVEVEKMKAEAEIAMKMQELELKKWQAIQENDRERDKQAAEMALKEREMELKFNVDINDSELKAQVQELRVRLDADVKREQAAQPQAIPV